MQVWRYLKRYNKVRKSSRNRERQTVSSFRTVKRMFDKQEKRETEYWKRCATLHLFDLVFDMNVECGIPPLSRGGPEQLPTSPAQKEWAASLVCQQSRYCTASQAVDNRPQLFATWQKNVCDNSRASPSICG